MRQSRLARFRRPIALAAAATAALALAACSAQTPSGGATEQKTLEVAYISFAVANTYDAPMLEAAQKVAKANNINVTVFDGNLDPAKQTSLIQDAIASGQYDGIITQPVYGPAIVDVVGQAVAAGIKVVNIDQILGTDFKTGKTQVDGIAANVVFVPSQLGKKFGEQTVAACKSKNLDPCNVAYLHDVKASAIGIALWDGFQAATKGSPVKVVAEGETFYNPAAAQTAVSDILTAHPEVDLIATSDQGLQGAVLAIDAAGKKASDFLMVGYGGSKWGQEHVANGAVFADVVQAPATEGKLGMLAMVDALRHKKHQGDVDPFKAFPNNGVMTKDTSSKFTGEWSG